MRGEGKRDPRPADSPGRLRQSEAGKANAHHLKPFQPGQTGNPEGKNGAKWLKQFRDYFDLPQQPGHPSRFLTVCQATYLKAIKGDVAAQRLIIEQMAGKAVNVDLTNSDGSLSPFAVPISSGERRAMLADILNKQIAPPDATAATVTEDQPPATEETSAAPESSDEPATAT